MGIDQHRKGRRGLAAARVIELVARKRRAPILEHPEQSSVGNIRRHLVFRHVGEAHSGQCRVQPQRHVVEHQLPVDAHFQFASALFEFPGVDSAVGRQADIDAVVRREILRLLRCWLALEIGRRADHGHAEIRPDAHRHHVLCHLFAEADAGVVALRDDVGEAVIDGELHLDIGVARQQLCQRGPEDRLRGMLADRDADGAGGLVAQLGQGGKLGVDLLEFGADGLEQSLAGFRRRHAAGGAGQQPQAQPLFEGADGVAQRRL